jgi:hypothetical protein
MRRLRYRFLSPEQIEKRVDLGVEVISGDAAPVPVERDPEDRDLDGCPLATQQRQRRASKGLLNGAKIAGRVAHDIIVHQGCDTYVDRRCSGVGAMGSGFGPVWSGNTAIDYCVGPS